MTMELEITGESELMSEMPRDTEKNKPRTEEMIPRGMGSSTGVINRVQWTRKSLAAR